MFTEAELKLIAVCADAEMAWLREIERRGIPSISNQAEVSSLRLKAVQQWETLQKEARAKAAAEEAKKKDLEDGAK